jgi:signal transduction histidine kinase
MNASAVLLSGEALVQGLAFAWASRGPALSARTRTALRLLALAALLPLLRVPPLAAAVPTVLALALLPRERSTVRQLAALGLDLAVILGAVGSLHATVLQPESPQVFAADLLTVAALGMLVNVGSPEPGLRAYWLLVIVVGLGSPLAAARQLETRWADAWLPWVVGLGSAARSFAALALSRAFHAPREAGVPHRASVAWLLGLNPLALFTPLALGVALVLALFHGRTHQVIPLGLALVVVSLLVGVRTVLAALENARLLREEQAAADRLQVERERARSEERARLLENVEDGFGAQLARTRREVAEGTLSQHQVGELLGDCLADLHLVIDSLKLQEDSLGAALGDYRYRLRRRLEGAPCRITWDLQLSESPALPTVAILQVLRVLQEALSNALRHAHATELSIHLSCPRTGPLLLRVSDDGQGLPSSQAAGGRGIPFMQRCAAGLGGSLVLRPGSEGRGVVAELTVPLPLSLQPRGTAALTASVTAPTVASP